MGIGKRKASQGRVRFVVDNERAALGLGLYKSGRNSSRGTPEAFSSSTTRSGGTPSERHLWTACREIPNNFASAATPPEDLMAFSTGEASDMIGSQPQVDSKVNRSLLARVNLRLHPYGMKISPLGKVIVRQLKKIRHTQEWLAGEVGVSKQAVSKWIRTGEMTLENLRATAKALQIGAGQMLDEEESTAEDEQWRSFSSVKKQKVLALMEELSKPSEDEKAPPLTAEEPKSKRSRASL